mgnify:CR=1 FL=1
MRRWVLFFLLAVFVVALPAILTRLSFLQIIEIRVSGVRVVSSDAVRDLTIEELSEYYFGIYPKKNIFFFSKKDIIETLKENFPRISSVGVSIEGFKSLSVEIVEREPSALWCEADDICFFLDESGFVFDRAPQFTDAVFVSFLGDLELGPSDAPVGRNFLNPELFGDLDRFLLALRRLDLPPALVKRTTLDEYEISLVSGEKILISMSVPLSQIISNLSSLLSDPKLSIRDSFGLSVSSLDLRFGNKVFFVRKVE